MCYEWVEKQFENLIFEDGLEIPVDLTCELTRDSEVKQKNIYLSADNCAKNLHKMAY